MASGSVLACFDGHHSAVMCCLPSMLHPDCVITGSADSTVRLWNVNKYKLTKTKTSNMLFICTNIVDKQLSIFFYLLNKIKSKEYPYLSNCLILIVLCYVKWNSISTFSNHYEYTLKNLDTLNIYNNSLSVILIYYLWVRMEILNDYARRIISSANKNFYNLKTFFYPHLPLCANFPFFKFTNFK